MITPIEILFDHPDFIVVNKPSGIPVQNDGQQPGILPVVCQQLGISRLWLVHRLDKVTSGILVLAKNADAAAVFGQLFEQKHIDKYYLALCTKKPKKKQGTVTGGMKKVRDGKWILDHSDNNLACTQFFSYSVISGVRLFLVKPLTGKTHQIRVALKSLGSPILGDDLYKGSVSERTYLHAFCIRFTYKNELVSIICPPENGAHFISAEAKTIISSLLQPWTLNWPKVKILAISHANN